MALNALELAVITSDIAEDSKIHITIDVIKDCVQKRPIAFDKSGDSHYDNISAFIKSMRGSDPDAAVFYLARAIEGGEDPEFLARRIIIAASEDVGMANPNALNVAVAVQAHSLGVRETGITVSEIVKEIKTSLNNGITKSPIVIISESFKSSVQDIQKALQAELNIDSRGMVLSYLLRGGAPSVLDRIFATQLGSFAVDLVKNNKSNVAIGVNKGKIFAMNLNEAVAVQRDFNYDLYNKLQKLYGLKIYDK